MVCPGPAATGNSYFGVDSGMVHLPPFSCILEKEVAPCFPVFIRSYVSCSTRDIWLENIFYQHFIRPLKMNRNTIQILTVINSILIIILGVALATGFFSDRAEDPQGENISGEIQALTESVSRLQERVASLQEQTTEADRGEDTNQQEDTDRNSSRDPRPEDTSGSRERAEESSREFPYDYPEDITPEQKEKIHRLQEIRESMEQLRSRRREEDLSDREIQELADELRSLRQEYERTYEELAGQLEELESRR